MRHRSRLPAFPSALGAALQAAYRGVRQRRKFLSWMSTKHLAATCVQRFFRGVLGRKRARCMLQVSVFRLAAFGTSKCYNPINLSFIVRSVNF